MRAVPSYVLVIFLELSVNSVSIGEMLCTHVQHNTKQKSFHSVVEASIEF